MQHKLSVSALDDRTIKLKIVCLLPCLWWKCRCRCMFSQLRYIYDGLLEPIRAETFGLCLQYLAMATGSLETNIIWISAHIIVKTPSDRSGNHAQSVTSLQEVQHSFIVNKAKKLWPLSPSHLLPPPWLQFGPLFQLKPLKSLLLACDPPRLQALPTTFGSPASCSVPRPCGQEDSPRRSEWVGVGGDQSRKGRGDQRSSRRAALNRNVRDEIKSTGLEILLTQTHGCTCAHKQYALILCVATWWDLFLSLPMIFRISWGCFAVTEITC